MSESSSSIHPFFQPRKTKTDSEDTFSPPKKVRQSTLTHSKETEEEISSQSINEESLPPTENEKKKKTSSSKRKSKEEKEEIEMAEPHKDKRIKKKSPEMIEPTKPVSHEKSDAKKRDRVANEPEKIKETDFNEKEFKKVKLTKRRNPQRAKAKQVESKSLKSKKVESEQTEAQQVESKQVESKQVEPKQVGSKKAEAQQAEAQQAEAQQAEAQQAEAQQTEDQQAKSKQKEFEQPKKAEPKKPFAFTKKQKAKYPKLLSEETLKAESSCAALRPLCSQESVKKDEFNFYGRIKQKPTKPRHDHEFSRLDRAIYKHGHCPARKIDSSLSPVVPRIENANHIQAIIKNHPHLNIMSTTTTRERPKRKIKRSLHGEKQIRAWLDNHFPDWHTFPSCVRLFKKIVGPRLPESSQQRWVEKYRPRTVDGLLGPKHNHVYLKDWLHKMKIEPTSAQGEPANKKKVRKNSVGDDIFKRMMIKQAKLDEEDDDFVDSSVAAQKIARQQQQQQQNQKEKPLRSNLILVVGDHGVGKTALVYTAAEQEGYEVFEVNAGSRRSGKDITSALREMTTSHLVTFNNKKVEAKPAKEEGSSKKKRKLNPLLSSMGMNNTISEKKSGLLNCFVRKKPDVVHNPDMKPQGPKQSLILLEEVDLLFEEDRGFWPAIVELSQTGKRPIIMTCNDPDQVPFEILCLQTVLNVLPPTIEEILPYLWLVCYAEDYIVDPKDLNYIVISPTLSKVSQAFIQT
ncbi:hypothetical protein G6F56_004100 [Rhizopus delemar]|nr:hypothetical protein G6F56_004100 [Rhizopus delemar]